MSSDQRGGRRVRPKSNVHRNLKVGLALLALFVVGAMSAGALAEGGAFSALGALTGSSSEETTTSDSTATDTTATTDTTSTETLPETTSSAPAPVWPRTSSSSPAAPPLLPPRRPSPLTTRRSTPASPPCACTPCSWPPTTPPPSPPTRTSPASRKTSRATPPPRRTTRTTAQQWALPRIGWDQVYGSVSPTGTATVAILDTGVDASTPISTATSSPAPRSSTAPTAGRDPNGHGTSMAGIVAAETNNGAGIAGVGYAGVKVMPVTVLDADGDRPGQRRHRGRRLRGRPRRGRDPDVVLEPGLLDVAAGGDRLRLVDRASCSSRRPATTARPTPTFPAGDRGVVGVSSTDSIDVLAAPRNYGADAFLAAPGEDIATRQRLRVSGTSASAAIVAGAAALLQGVVGRRLERRHRLAPRAERRRRRARPRRPATAG